jgi:hypothetical protein
MNVMRLVISYSRSFLPRGQDIDTRVVHVARATWGRLLPAFLFSSAGRSEEFDFYLRVPGQGEASVMSKGIVGNSRCQLKASEASLYLHTGVYSVFVLHSLLLHVYICVVE